MQEQFPGQEFPGDDPTNYLNRVPYRAPFDLARSPRKVLDELGHEFRATLLQEEHSQGRLAPNTSLEIHAEAAANTLLLSDTATGKTATVQFSAQDDPSVLGWASLGAFHVVECSGVFTTVAAASAHLATGTTSGGERDDADGTGGAFKVLIAAASPDAPRFYPRVNLREYRVEQSVFACAPPGDDGHLAGHGHDSAVDENHVWQYADHVLELLNCPFQNRITHD
ncbi:hypothetical protein SLS63_012193 [Diaporthe eres]|uniref:Glyceraldehyde 3-phosphate dehydrogenase NAD(P) binding domain-containing protein n=1 Tax=Diaporthe eres TaxID=83184 RepID=A0ABR1NRX3_DIAER